MTGEFRWQLAAEAIPAKLLNVAGACAIQRETLNYKHVFDSIGAQI